MTQPMPSVFQYDYTSAKEACELAGLKMDYRMLEVADREFSAAHLTQKQVDTVMNLHIHLQVWQWTPKNYSYLSRILIALHWLFKRKV